MDWRSLMEWVTKPEHALLLTGSVGVLLTWNLILTLRWWRFQRRWGILLRGTEGQPLETILYECLRRISLLEDAFSRQGSHLQQLQAQADRCLQQVGMVRFDAFEDVGGQQSFALALLDRQGDGFVLSGLYSRREMRVYAKAVSRGRSEIALSREEEQAIRDAEGAWMREHRG